MDFHYLRRVVAQATDSTASAAGPTIGRYVIDCELARGGMGIVYKAYDPSLKRAVAVKVIKDGDHDPRNTVRLHREAAAAAKLRHANIVAVHEVGEDGGRHFIAMDFIDGMTLREARLSPRPAIEVLEPVARAIHYAHTQGVIHRDLKPDNILLDRERRPFVADFGLARVTSSTMNLTRSGDILGTPVYMAPEQVRGDVAGPPADVYALGVILYEVLAGRVPFEHPKAEQLFYAILDGNPARIPAADRDLETIARKAMSVEKGDRYASANDLADDLKRWLTGLPIAARPLSTATLTLRWVQRHRVLVSLASLLLVAAGIATWYALAAQRATGQIQSTVADVALLADQATQAYDSSLLAPAHPIDAERTELARAGEALRRLSAQTPEALVYLGRIEARLGRPDAALKSIDDGIAKLGTRATGAHYLERALVRVDLLMSRLAVRVAPSADTRKRAQDDLAEARRRGLGIKGDRADYIDAIEKFISAEARACIEICNRLLARTLPPTLRADVLYVKGASRLLLGDDARTDLAEAADIKRSDISILILAAAAHISPKDVARGLAFAERATTVDPSCEAAWLTLGTLLDLDGEERMKLGDDPGPPFERAALAFKRTRTPAALAEAARLHLNIGRWKSSCDEFHEAIKCAEQSLAIEPDNDHAFLCLADAMSLLAEFDVPRQMEWIDKAVTRYDDLIKRSGSYAIAWLGRGLALRKKANFLWFSGQDPEPTWKVAIDSLDRSIELDPRDEFAHEQRGMVFYSRAVFRGGKKQPEWHRDAVEAEESLVKSSAVTALCGLVQVRLMLRKNDAALADARRAVERAPNMARTHAVLGDALLTAGEKKAALAEYAKAVELDPALATPLRQSMDECRE